MKKKSADKPALLPLGNYREWQMASSMLAFVVFLPLIVLAFSWLSIDNDVWAHLADTLLPDVIANTAILLAGVSVGVLLLGISLAAFRVAGG